MLLGDVGGFTGFLVYLSSVMLSIFTYENSTDYITKSLYKGENDEELDRKPYLAFKGYLQSCLPSCCLISKCLRRSEKDKELIEARKNLIKEMDLVRIIQQMRIFNQLTNQIMPKEKEEMIKNSSA